jgi:hypothetical protein
MLVDNICYFLCFRNISKSKKPTPKPVVNHFPWTAREKFVNSFYFLFDNSLVSDVVVEGGESCEKALTEATRTSYVEGRWISDDDLANTQYKILEAFLPADGDYSHYSVWRECCVCVFSN